MATTSKRKKWHGQAAGTGPDQRSNQPKFEAVEFGRIPEPKSAEPEPTPEPAPEPKAKAMPVKKTVKKRGETFDPEAAETGRPKKRRWYLLGFVGLAIIFVWLIPVLIAQPVVLNWIIARATSRVDGTITVKGASLGWLSSPAIVGLEVRDAEQQALLAVPHASADKTLIQLILDRSNLGRFTLDEPTLTVHLLEDGSNLESFLAPLLDTPSEEPSKRVALSVEIVDACVEVIDPVVGDVWNIHEIQLSLNVPVAETEPIELKTSGVFVDQPVPGEFAVEAKLHQSTAGLQSGQATASTKNLPLVMLTTPIGRFAPITELGGRLSSTVECSFNLQENARALSVAGNVTADEFRLAAPALGSDRLGLARIQAACKMACQGDRLVIDQAVVQSDVGSLSLSGTIDLGDQATANPIDWLPRQICRADGQVDLARLAKLLPNTLHIREDTEIVSGQLQVSLASESQPDRTVWRGTVQAANFTAANAGKQYQWQQPILLTLAAYQGADGPVVESLDCRSTFLALHASGTLQQMTGQGSFDLNRLAAELGQFVDLGGLSIAGGGQADVSWKQTADDQFKTGGRLQVRGFRFATVDGRPWNEELLTATFSAAGKTDFGAQTRLDSATLEVIGGLDQAARLSAQLTEPIADLSSGRLPVEIRSSGQLAQWLSRIDPWVELDAWDVSGSYDLSARLTGSAESVTLENARLTLGQLSVRTESINVAEPRVELTASGGWDSSARRLVLKSAVLTSSSMAAQADDVVLAIPPDGPVELAGTASCRGNLQRIGQWIARPGAPPAWSLAGELVGSAKFRQSGETIAGDFNAVVDNLVAVSQTGRRVEERQVRLAGRGSYNTESRSLELEEASLASGMLSAGATGRLNSDGERSTLEADGTIKYDMQKLSELLSSQAGRVTLAGGGTSPIWYRGPLTPADATAGATLDWTRIDAYGFQVGQGRIEANLSGGMLVVKPLDLDVSEGRMHLAPRVRISPEPMELTVPPGPLAQQVRINPEMCKHALQFVAPVLAGVATAEGTFSVELEGCRIPLTDLAKGEVAGRMTIHSAQIGPGPMVEELAVLLDRAGPAQLARESVIAFRMVDGKVYHQGLELVFPNLTIRTYGWVGLDKTMAIMAEMPVPPKWRGSNPVFDSATRDQIIRLPIGGTLDKPQIDRQVFDQLSRQFIRKATQNLIEDEIGKGLQRLFGPQQ